MAKQSGLGAGLFLNGVDLSGDTQSVDMDKNGKLIEMTGINKLAFERAMTHLDSTLDWTSYFNPTNAHVELQKPPSSDVVGLYVTKLDTLGAHAAGFTGKRVTYNFSRGNDGSLTAKVSVPQSTNWADWGLTLTTGIRTDTAATNGTSVDFGSWGAPAAYGLRFYVQSLSVTGTSTTYKVQHSSDNGVGDAWADVAGATLTVTSGDTTRGGMVAVTGAVERYLRVVTSGTFTNTQFVAMACVNVTDMSLV